MYNSVKVIKKQCKVIQVYRVVGTAFPHLFSLDYIKTEVPNLGNMYLWGYFCLSEGVHLRLSIEQKYIVTHLLIEKFMHISKHYFKKPLCAYFLIYL